MCVKSGKRANFTRQPSNTCLAMWLPLSALGSVAADLNIEGPRIYNSSHTHFNIVQVIDEPLKGETFEKVMQTVRNGKHELIETAVGIDDTLFLQQLKSLIETLQATHPRLLVHVHQYAGSTALDARLRALTSAVVITARTNFFETPVDYTKYTDVDAILSLSQCAGFDLPPGTWILPTAYRQFDVANKLVLPAEFTAAANIRPFLPECLDVVEGTILYVDGLWNPCLDTDLGVLVLDADDVKVLEFVMNSTKVFDESHDWRHAVAVAVNACTILNTKEVLYLALLHDVCDHKYPAAMPRAELSAWVAEALPLFPALDALIDMVSFSKQKATEAAPPPPRSLPSATATKWRPSGRLAFAVWSSADEGRPPARRRRPALLRQTPAPGAGGVYC